MRLHVINPNTTASMTRAIAAAAVKLAEAMHGLGLATSKHGDYAPPLAKPWAGEFARFAP